MNTLVNKSLSGGGELVARWDVFPDGIVERNSTGPPLVLEVVKELEFPLDLISVLELSWGLDFGAIVSPGGFHPYNR